MNKKVHLIISCFGVHMGGGLVLLNSLLGAVRQHESTLLLDERLINNANINYSSPRTKIISVKRNFYSRFISLHKFSNKKNKNSILLCFNGLPPIFKKSFKVISFIQSPHFIGDQVGIDYPILTEVRFILENVWLHFGIKNCDEVWVQSETIKRGLLQRFPSTPIRVISLVDDRLYENRNILLNTGIKKKEKHIDKRFFYPADAVAHKNHKNLLMAWYELSKKGLYPQLVLTLGVSEFVHLKKSLNIYDYDFENVISLGRISRDRVLSELKNSSALIFPSLAETFGLPLLEARIAGAPIIASELDFVREICNPNESFNPRSYFSISDALMRFLNVPDGDLRYLCNAKMFVEKLIDLDCQK